MLANYGSCLHHYIIFWTCPAASHFTFCISLVDNVLTSCVKLYSVHVNFKRTNQSFWSSKISQSIHAEWRTCDRYGKQFSHSKQDFQWKQPPKLLCCRKRCSQNFTGKHFYWRLSLIKLQAWVPATQVFSIEICTIFKNTCIFMQIYLQSMKKIQLTRRN